MVEKFLLIYEKFLKVLTKLVGVIAGALVMYCAFSIVWEVIARGVLIRRRNGLWKFPPTAY